MIVLVLDPATSTGYCLVNIVNYFETISSNNNSEITLNIVGKMNKLALTSKRKAIIYEHGFIDVNTSSEYQGDHCIDLMVKIQKLIDKHKVEYIGIEDYFFSGKFATGSNVNAAYRTAIHILSRQLNIPYKILNISSWKKYIAGRSTPTKSQKTKWGATSSNKLFIQEALYKKYGIRFPNHSISLKTGKPIKFRSDIVDAVAQAIYLCYSEFNITFIESILPHIEDHNFKNIPSGTYIYPN